MSKTWGHMAGLAGLALAAACTAPDGGGDGWLSWRGPHQNGTSDETGLFDSVEVDGEHHLWSLDMAGRGTPTVANGRVYCLGYAGTGPDLQERMLCLDLETGEVLFERRFTDFVNDSIYSRYAIGSVTVDAESQRLYFLTSPGLLNCMTMDGDLLWQRSMMEQFGRLTFPNGRTGTPAVDGDLVIVNCISSNWGPQGPARNRFYAFDKETGDNVWSSTPAVTPKDSSFSMPVFEWRNGRRVFYAGTGCGHVVCVDASTGEPIWRFQMSYGGVNSSPVLYGDSLICIHGRENVDTSENGRMVAIKLTDIPEADGPVVLGEEHELWRNHLNIFTSSPVLAGNRIYQTIHAGELCSVDADTGHVLWEEKFGTEQIHASPLYADGKLYVPMNDGSFHIVRPTDEGPERLCSVQLEGSCLAQPSVYGGRMLVHTTEKLYCFGKPNGQTPSWPAREAAPAPGEAASLQIVPADIQLHPGQTATVTARSLDANGQIVAEGLTELEWTLPANLDADFGEDGLTISVPEDGRLGAAYVAVQKDGLEGTIRLRVQPAMPFVEDFNSYPLVVDHYAEEGVKMAFPPSYWFSAKPKWEVRTLEDEQVLAKRLDNMLFQRSTSMIGSPEMSEYTASMDVRTDGNRRTMSSAGLVNQRYLIVMKGNAQEIELSSNYERIREQVKFKWKPGIWYTLKTRCDNQDDGSVLIRAKAWPRDEEEPATWNLEYTHQNGNQKGAVALYGYAPQVRFRVYVDNLRVTPNESDGAE